MQPGVTEGVTEFIDIFPTLCELAGITIPDDLDGVSLVPLMKDPGNEVREFAVSQFPRGGNIMGYSIRTTRYRLTYWIGEGFRTTMPFDDDLVVAKELYDYRRDPLETVNVADKLRYRRVYRKMSGLMLDFFENYN